MVGKMSEVALIVTLICAERILMMNGEKSWEEQTDVKDVGGLAIGLLSAMRAHGFWSVIRAVVKGTHHHNVMRIHMCSIRMVNSKSLMRTRRASKIRVVSWAQRPRRSLVITQRKHTMATFYNIIHKTDKAFAPFHASTYEYACKLFAAIHAGNPELSGKLEIITVTPGEPGPYTPAPDRPWHCSCTY